MKRKKKKKRGRERKKRRSGTFFKIITRESHKQRKRAGTRTRTRRRTRTRVAAIKRECCATRGFIEMGENRYYTCARDPACCVNCDAIERFVRARFPYPGSERARTRDALSLSLSLSEILAEESTSQPGRRLVHALSIYRRSIARGE